MLADNIDSPERVNEIRQKILGKTFLRQWYEEIYQKYKNVVSKSPNQGFVVELGSGAGFAKNIIPELIATDTIAYDGIDQIVDATKMPFTDSSVRALLMMNVFHHIPDVEAFLKEAERCLVPGGRIFIVDQHRGWISKPVLKYAHHEDFDDKTNDWKFKSTGPLSSANGALAWIVFCRDLLEFQRKFSGLKIEKYATHSPLRYWVSGGLKNWCLLPGSAFETATKIDKLLVNISHNLGSFVDIEIVKTS